MSELKKIYKKIKTEIDNKLGEFKNLWETGNDFDLFKEMCFCTCTPQNDALKAWNAVLRCEEKKAIESGNHTALASILRDNGVRFHSNKAKYIIANRKEFFPGTKKILKEHLNEKTLAAARDGLQKNVSGWGLKESSHFLRNIGMGDTICILDRHILRQLAIYGVISEIPKTITEKAYHQIEQDMLQFANDEAIPCDALDLVFWYKEKGSLFK